MGIRKGSSVRLYTNPLYGLILAGVFALVILLINKINRPMVLSEQSVALPNPQNVTVGNFFCKNNWPWATVSWDSVAGANAYRIKFWDTSSKLLHSEPAESASKTTEMYLKMDTYITIQGLRREERNGELTVVQESNDSEKVNLKASVMQEVCNKGISDTYKTEAETTPTVTNEQERTEITVTKSPTPVPENKGREEKAADNQQSETNKALNELETKVSRLEKENEELKSKQNSLELLVQQFISALKTVFHF